MVVIKIDLSNTVKNMKPMHGGGQPPIRGAANFCDFHYMTEAGIPYSRLHDVAGYFGAGKYVDIPNIFRNFDADENNPENYDFTYTDLLIKNIIEAKVEPYFRLGITIENSAEIKAYYTNPPADYNKWARICEHIIAHYTEGWANGFTYKIKYWEIWNEPECPRQQMWSGSAEEYYELYDVAAKHLKKRFPHLSIGGYASCGFSAVTTADVPIPDVEKSFITFFEGFFKYIKENNTPIDFFSWHSYMPTKRTVEADAWLHNRLAELGYADLETHLNEWDCYPEEFGTEHHSAEIAATMIAMQHGFADILCIYDMRTNTSPYCPLFDIRTHKPIHSYYSMVAFNTLYKLKNQVETVCDTKELYVLAASDGKKNAMMISNLTGEKQQLEINGADFSDARFHVIDNDHLLSWIPDANEIENNTVILVEW